MKSWPLEIQERKDRNVPLMVSMSVLYARPAMVLIKYPESAAATVFTVEQRSHNKKHHSKNVIHNKVLFEAGRAPNQCIINIHQESISWCNLI